MCTSIYQVTGDHTHLLARTMDWPTLAVSPLFVPRHFRWATAFDHRVYENRYAMVGGGSLSASRIDVSDGVNEYGLMAQKLTFDNGVHYQDARRADKVQLAAYEFIFWALGNFRSIQDLADHLDDVELMSELNSDTKYGKPELHFVLADRTGRVVVIEPSQTPLKVIENPLGVVTNSPDFARQLAQMERYVDFTADFRAGRVPLNTPRVTTGRLSGKANPPGYYSPSARFIRAAYLKERSDVPADEAAGLVSEWHLLDSVTVPQNRRHQRTYSVYRAVTVAESRSYYFQSYHRGDITKLQLTDDMLEWTKPKVYHVPDRLTVREVK
ncbi:MAG: linear amide C-N hydrolase [Limosilactobacillus pontis]|uniref:Choloylglycine hydrolase n=1 Tax=Limosilactobacillus pontis TaxID=35787 RepID=A0A2J6NM40_9LACO|nr:linear amide C-N hydrolase [Limosilactobacillus pontis]PMB82383.1 choloylglycine hydrolase [Limosilactobacillus pontis]